MALSLRVELRNADGACGVRRVRLAAAQYGDAVGAVQRWVDGAFLLECADPEEMGCWVGVTAEDEWDECVRVADSGAATLRLRVTLAPGCSLRDALTRPGASLASVSGGSAANTGSVHGAMDSRHGYPPSAPAADVADHEGPFAEAPALLPADCDAPPPPLPPFTRQGLAAREACYTRLPNYRAGGSAVSPPASPSADAGTDDPLDGYVAPEELEPLLDAAPGSDGGRGVAAVCRTIPELWGWRLAPHRQQNLSIA